MPPVITEEKYLRSIVMADVSNLDQWLTKLAGVAGAAVSLRFIQGTWPERIVMALGGALLSLYAAPWASSVSGLPEGLTGFLTGLLGMALLARVYEGFQALPVAEILKSWLERPGRVDDSGRGDGK